MWGCNVCVLAADPIDPPLFCLFFRLPAILLDEREANVLKFFHHVNSCEHFISPAAQIGWCVAEPTNAAQAKIFSVPATIVCASIVNKRDSAPRAARQPIGPVLAAYDAV